MEKITIDQIGIDAHKRYAIDQESLETKYLTESTAIQPQLEIAGTSMIYSSKWEELFEFNFCNTTWAAFLPPPNYRTQRNKFFSHALIPGILWSEAEEDEDLEEDEDTENERKKQNHLINQIIESLSTGSIKEDESALLNLIQSIKTLNSLLREVNARKLQYQKG